MNESMAREWLRKAWHDLSSAQILWDANHFTDVIGAQTQQAMEKTLKAFYAWENRRIPRSHDLVQLHSGIDSHLRLEEYQIDWLDMATGYYKTERYPVPVYGLPPREEVEEVLAFAHELLTMACRHLHIEKESLENS